MSNLKGSSPSFTPTTSIPTNGTSNNSNNFGSPKMDGVKTSLDESIRRSNAEGHNAFVHDG